MIAALNLVTEFVEDHLTEEIDLSVLAAELGTTEYHLRRMFSSLAGMPLSEYVRRRRMAVAAAEVLGEADLLETAVRYGYGSTEAFGRAFRSVHGAGPSEVRRDGGPLRAQGRLSFRLTVEGSTAMHTRIIERPAFRLVGNAARVPLIHTGVNPRILEHIGSLPAEAHSRLKALGDTEPAGLLQVSADVDVHYAEGSELTYLHGVAVSTAVAVPDDLDVLEVETGTWAVFRVEGAYPSALQSTWAATASEWFASHPWMLRPGPSLVAVLERDADFTSATCELWLPIQHADALR